MLKFSISNSQLQSKSNLLLRSKNLILSQKTRKYHLDWSNTWWSKEPSKPLFSKQISLTMSRLCRFPLEDGETIYSSIGFHLRSSKWRSISSKGQIWNLQSFHLLIISWWYCATVRHAMFSKLRPLSCPKTKCKTFLLTRSSVHPWTFHSQSFCQGTHQQLLAVPSTS